MIFKLVRTDTDDPTKILLPIGINLIGRGKLLNCDDKRISRNHGELNVTNDYVVLKALHMNPCFYINKEKEGVQILNINSKTNLSIGDKFGLLPDSFWFEIVQCEVPNTAKTAAENGTPDNVETQLEETKNSTEESEAKPAQTESDNELLDINVNDESGSIERAESPSLISTEIQEATNENTSKNDDQDSNNSINEKVPSENNADASLNYTDAQNNESPISENEANTSNDEALRNQELNQSTNSPSPFKQSNQNEENPRTPSKRSHDDDNEEPELDEKKIKLEPEDVKPVQEIDNKPGTSNQVPAGNNDKKVLSPQKPRERCIYGANCYRKNPQHRLEFTHPSEPDWGAGERGQCPWGRTCRRRDPRHWQHHDHPPGVLPPPYARPGMQHVERQGNNIYIMNAHIVNIHDDHFQLVDSDGDSVDYDYEF